MVTGDNFPNTWQETDGNIPKHLVAITVNSPHHLAGDLRGWNKAFLNKGQVSRLKQEAELTEEEEEDEEEGREGGGGRERERERERKKVTQKLKCRTTQQVGKPCSVSLLHPSRKELGKLSHKTWDRGGWGGGGPFL